MKVGHEEQEEYPHAEVWVAEQCRTHALFVEQCVQNDEQ